VSNAAITMDGQITVTPTALAWNFIHWGLGLFITGFLTGFIPILHYMVGGVSGDVGPEFTRTIALPYPLARHRKRWRRPPLKS
jgi:hypothetical protein